jgi:hypothetical protein
VTEEQPARGPLFLVGASRSGTALLRSALNLSSTVFIAGETHYFDDLRPRLGPLATQPLDAVHARTCEDYFLALSHRPYGHGGQVDRARLGRGQLQTAAAEVGTGGDAYFEAYCRLSRSWEPDAAATPERWGEKTPRHVFRLDDLLTRYPDSQAVCMYRDPRAVAASYRSWRHQGGFAAQLEDDEGYAEALDAEERRAQASYDPSLVGLLWRSTLRAGLRALDGYGPERVLLLRYEDLVSQPESTLRALMDWLGLRYEQQMLDMPHHNSSFTRFQAGAGASTVGIDRWRTVLPPADIAAVQVWSRQGLDRLGYPLVDTGVGWPGQARRLATLLPVAVRAVWVNRNRTGRLIPYVWRRVRPLRSAAH